MRALNATTMSRFAHASVAALAAFFGAACASPTTPTSCGAGATLDGGTCVALTFECTLGTHRVGSACVSDGDGGGAGAGWRPNVRVATPLIGWSSSPRLAVATDGTIFVALVANADRSHAVLYRSVDDGRSFSPVDDRAAGPSNWIASVALTDDGTGVVYWAWVENSGTPLAATGALTVAISRDGSTYSVLADLCGSGSTDSCSLPWLSTRPDGAVAILYGSEPANMVGNPLYGPTPQWAVSSHQGPFAPQLAFPSDFLGADLSGPLAFLPSGDALATAAQSGISLGSGGAVLDLGMLRFSSSAWEPIDVTQLPVPDHFAFQPRDFVATSVDGHVGFAYLESVGEHLVPMFAFGMGQVTTTVPVTGRGWSSGGAALPTAAFDGHGVAWVMWLDNRFGAWLPVIAFTVTGGDFSAPEAVGDAPFVEDDTSARSIGDALALVVRNGRRYAAWTDTREGTSQVYFATAPLP